jgi:N-acetyl-1-D-myo-inositol-2-amino-2-deoxy-alpha-D-glucopyranoside deacetylase
MSGHRETQGSAGRARLLFIHAHPDDETLTTGLTMAGYALRHHDVHVLTCTLGEEGEVIPPALAHLSAGRDDTLGPWRREELRAAMSVLGVSHSVLGEDLLRGTASRYRDSGMAGAASTRHPDAFVGADPAEAAALVADHIRALRPHVVVTYDAQGGYGHPDHIQTHRVTMSALSALAGESHDEADDRTEDGGAAVPVAFCILTPASWARQDRRWLQDNVIPGNPSSVVVPHPDEPYPPSVVADGTVTHVVEEPTLVEMQARALARHATQVVVHEGYYSLSNHVAFRLGGREGFAQFDPVHRHLVPARRSVCAPRYGPHPGLLDHYQDHG